MKGFRFWLISPLVLMLSGCSLFGPGMHMNTMQLTPVVNAQNQVVQPQIQIINASLILRQREIAAKEKQLQLSQYHTPKGFAANTNNYDYKVAPQDVLQITVWNESGLSAQADLQSAAHANFSSALDSLGSSTKNTSNPNSDFIVNSRGNIFYPYLGSIHVQGRSASQVRKLITRKMSHFFANPQVTVNVLAFNGKHISVTGAVLRPTTIPITNVPLDVLTAVTQAGGPIRCGASTSTTSVVTTCADLHSVEIRRGRRVVKVNLNQLTAINGSSNNWILKNNDIVYVPNNNASRIFVLGAVGSPDTYNMIDGKMTLREALGDAKGMSLGSNPRFTYVIRDYRQDPKMFLLNLSSPDALNLAGEFNLKPSDIVYVSTSALYNFGQVMNEVSGPLLTAVAIKSLAT